MPDVDSQKATKRGKLVMASSSSAAPLTRIQIDCSGPGHGSSSSSHSMFSDLPIGKNIAIRNEVATGAEKKALLAGDDEMQQQRYESSRRDNSCVGSVQRIAPCLMYLTCALALVIGIVFVCLFYMQLTEAVDSIDKAASIRTRTVNMIKNADMILDKSAQLTDVVNQLGGISLNAAMFSKPYLTRVLNSTTNTIDDLHSLMEKPTIQLHGRRRRRR